MSRKSLRVWNAIQAMDAHQGVLRKQREAGADVEAEGYDAYKPRNRAEKRMRVRTLPRAFRKSIHGRGAWRTKFIQEGEYGRH